MKLENRISTEPNDKYEKNSNYKIRFLILIKTSKALKSCSLM